jgi:peptide/nickel transport system permease protein
MSKANDLWQQVLHSDLFYYYKRDKVAIVSSLVFVTLALMALFSPLIAPFDPYDLTQIDLMDSEMPPSWLPMRTNAFCSAPTTRGATCGARFSMACACRC